MQFKRRNYQIALDSIFNRAPAAYTLQCLSVSKMKD